MTNRSISLSSTWLKAAVLGSVWASSEIVLGSFFHNLRVPFSSIILTGIAIILVVSVSYRWKDRGLIWRAGLVCAVMKSVSPSAIIFGPMIAILFEALLIELSLLLLGKNIAGFLIGGMLAMSWNLVQKIINMLIYYGFNIVELYTSLVVYSGKQLNIPSPDAWTPVLLLWSLYLFFGAVSAIAGMVIGRASPVYDPGTYTPREPDSLEESKKRSSSAFEYSIAWLGYTIAGMLLVLFLMNYTTIIWWASCGLILLIMWVLKYHGILRGLMKPKFWIIFILITMLSSFVLVQAQSSHLTWMDGFMAGVEMNFRAAIMMVGFSIIGKEMSNPVIRDLFLRSSFRQLPMALEVAFETLPFALSNMPPLTEISKHPIRSLQKFGAQTEIWLARLENSGRQKPRVVIVCGKTGEGKTTLLTGLAKRFQEAGVTIRGIVAPAVFEQSAKAGYNIVDVESHRSMRLAYTEELPAMMKVGRFYFDEKAVQFGKQTLCPEIVKSARLVFIDEIGPWELDGGGWSECLSNILLNGKSTLLISVRESLVPRVIAHWHLENPMIITVGEVSIDEAYNRIRENIWNEGG